MPLVGRPPNRTLQICSDTHAMLDTQQCEMNSLRWMIGLGFTALAILIAVLLLLN